MEKYKGLNRWFDRHHYDKLTYDFLAWWEKEYPLEKDFVKSKDTDELDEYFVRMGFALMGWLAAKEDILIKSTELWTKVFLENPKKQ